MKFSYRRERQAQAAPDLTARLQDSAAALTVPESHSLAAVVASAFTRLRVGERVRVLRCLLQPVGPMALAVLGGGVFAKYIAQARLPRMSVSLEDAARVTSSQVYELVRYIEQSSPVTMHQVLTVLSRDAAAMAVIGGSVAAILMQHVTNRGAARAPAAPRETAQPTLRERGEP